MRGYRELLGQRTARVVENASFTRRSGAFLADLLLINITISAPFAPLFSDLFEKGFWQSSYELPVYTLAQLAAAMVLFAIVLAYFVLFEYLLGQTPGMMLLNTRAEGSSRLWAAVARNIFLIPVFPIVLLWIIEPLFILVRRQSVLEQLSGTKTIHERVIPV